MRKKNNNFFQSFNCAIRGLTHSILNERNMRIHISFLVSISYFAYFYGISKLEWLALILTCFVVIINEIINTAIESTVDTAVKSYNHYARVAKDVAAGAVLVAGICAIIVGIFIFSDIGKISSCLIKLFTMPVLPITALLIVLVFSFILFVGKKRIKKDKFGGCNE